MKMRMTFSDLIPHISEYDIEEFMEDINTTFIFKTNGVNINNDELTIGDVQWEVRFGNLNIQLIDAIRSNRVLSDDNIKNIKSLKIVDDCDCVGAHGRLERAVVPYNFQGIILGKKIIICETKDTKGSVPGAEISSGFMICDTTEEMDTHVKTLLDSKHEIETIISSL